MMSTWSYSHKPMPSTLSVVCFSYTSRLKWCLQEPKKTVPCSMLYTGCFSYTSRLKWCLQKLLPKNSARYAIYKMFLLHIQAEMVPTANISHKAMPRTLSMFLLHIKAQMVPTENFHKPMPTSISTGCFSYTSRPKLRIHWTTPTNPCPACSLTACFSYICMHKWCLQELLPWTHTQNALTTGPFS